MNRIILAWFEKLIGMYPPGFKADFGDELRQVFSQALAENTFQGRLSIIGFFWRELRDLPASLLLQHRLEWQAKRGMQAASTMQLSASGEASLMTRRNTIILISLAALGYALLIPACAYGYTIFELAWARSAGVYPSPEEGMRTMLENSYEGIQKIEIEHAGTNSFDGSHPHVWFVTARVWADRRGDGEPLHPNGYDYPGSFFLKVHDGWVHIGEGAFPEFIGWMMQVFHLEGQ